MPYQMIPTLQLDPSTLAIWFNADLLNSYKEEEHGLELFIHAASHDISKVCPILDNAGSDTHRSHYYEILSAVWHEKRHFVDFLLTNFGAFHVRTYFQMYYNTPQALRELRKKNSPVLLPLDTYADPVKLMGLGIEEQQPSELLKIAQWLRRRKQALREDACPYDGGRGLTEHGGLAQMEAIAYTCQLAILQFEFGTDAIKLLNQHSPLPLHQNRRYSWARDLWCRLPPNPDFTASAKVVNVDVMLAIMVASLCGRTFTLTGETNIPSEGDAPSLRFLKLFTSERWDRYAEADIGEVWSRVDAKAKELWGFTIEEELLQDWEIESKLLDTLKSEGGGPPIVSAFEKYHAKRRVVIDDFISSPSRYTSVIGYWELLRDGVSPLQVICSPSGQPFSGSMKALFEYDFSQFGIQTFLNPKGWYAIANPHLSIQSSDKIAFGFDEDWISILTEFSPVTKLLVSGRAQRVMLGAELARGEQLLSEIGLRTQFVAPYDKLQGGISGEAYSHLTGRDEAVCDFSGKTVKASDFDFISPWEIRSDQARRGFFEYIAERMGSEPMAAFTIAKDWSHWLTSKSHAAELRSRFGLSP